MSWMQNKRDLKQIWSAVMPLTSNFQCQICRQMCLSRIALLSYIKSHLQEFILMLLQLELERELSSIKVANYGIIYQLRLKTYNQPGLSSTNLKIIQYSLLYNFFFLV